MTNLTKSYLILDEYCIYLKRDREIERERVRESNRIVYFGGFFIFKNYVRFYFNSVAYLSSYSVGTYA
jgi:hypothetical protein